MSNLVVLPVLVALGGAALALIAWRSPRLQRAIGIGATAGLLAAGIALLAVVEREGIVVLDLGGWPAPFGITFVADLFSAILVVLTGVLGLAVAVYSAGTIDRGRQAFGYYPLLLVMLAGVCGAFLTGDLFNLYVWFEVLLVASFVLMTLGGEKAQLEGGLKYVALNLVASALFLAGVGVLYGLAGTVNLADLAVKLGSEEPHGLVTAVAMLFLVAFGIKAAVVPLFFWLPASYHTPPVAVTAIFAGLLTKVGVYALVRVFTLVFVDDADLVQAVLLVVAGLTMVVGVLGAVAQLDMRRLLSFHIISQIGYLVMGLGLFTASALAGLVYFLVHVSIAKSTLFLVGGAIDRLEGSYDLRRLGGLYATRPLLAGLFLVAAMSLAGVPPFSGFLAKLALVEAGLAAGQGAIIAVALGVSLLTLYSMLKIWNEAFWKPAPADARGRAASGLSQVDPPGGAAAPAMGGTAATDAAAAGSPGSRPLGLLILAPIVALVACSVALTIAAGPAFELVDRAAEQLLDPAGYVQAVLGTAP
jgi:multicomponent Na+:H+ antiporter subunit D